MTTTTNYPESPEGSSPANCPHCGARQAASDPRSDAVTFKCDSFISGDFYQSDLCRERAAHAETKKTLAATQNLAADQAVRLAKLATELTETRKELEALRIQSKAYSDGVVDAALKLRDVIQEIRGAWPDNPNGLGGQSVIKAASELLREQAAQLARIREAVRQQCGVAFWDQIAGQQGVTTKAKEGK